LERLIVPKLHIFGRIFGSLIFVTATLSTVGPSLVKAASIVRLHDDADLHWHDCTPTEALADDPLSCLILAQHRANFDLWHEEDEARCPDATAECIADVKHAIDRHNQQRNDLVERIDQFLLELAGPQNDAAPLNSETPGLIIDRLSILALKIFHTREEVFRPTASDQHHDRNQHRLAILVQQRADLAQCLDELWEQVLAGKRRFRLYRQMKMYNDPELNPMIYTHKH